MNNKTFRLTATAMMIALTFILGLFGYITIPFTTIEITVMCLPVIIGTVMLGWRQGLVLGLIFGLTSLYKALTAPSPLLAPLLQFPLALYPSIFIPRLLIPLATWGVYRLTRKLPKAIGIGLTTAAGSLTNTVLFLGMAFFLGANPVAAHFGMTVEAVGNTLATVVLTNGLPEMAAAIIICTPVLLALNKLYKKD